MSEPFDVPAATVARLGSLCLALPEAHEELAWVGTRWRIRSQTFAHLLPVVDGRPPSYAEAAGLTEPAVVLTFRVPFEDFAALQQLGPPYFGVRWGRAVGGVVLGDDTDWSEIAEFVTDSYCLVAPRRLAAQVEAPPVA
jgi:predicted DNA-binding protein (MmcQ/YjbR family)